MAVTAQQLTQLYLAYFGRPPDFDGMIYYTTQSNLTLQQVAANFSASPESQALYGSTSLAGVIDAIYMNLFNRHAEPGGLTYWSTQIASGAISPAYAAYAILIGAQNADKVSVQNKMQVATDWLAHLDTTAEITAYSGNTAAGEARAFLATVDSTTASLTAAESGLDAAIFNMVNGVDNNPIAIAISSPTIVEGNSGTKQLAFVVTLNHASATAVTVSYTTGGGTATAGDDYEATAGSITFQPGQTTAVVNITVDGDITVEDNETVGLTVTGAQISNSPVSAMGTIVNDDITPQLTTGIDTITVAGTGPNTIKGVVDGGTPSNSTFSVGDTIHGNGQTTVELVVSVPGTAAFAYMDNIAAVNVVAGAAGAISFNAIEWTNVGAVNLASGVGGATLQLISLADSVDLGIGAGVAGAISASYDSGLFVDMINGSKGGASYEASAGDLTIHLNTDGKSATAILGNTADGITAGNIVIDGGADNAGAHVTVSAGGDVSLGDITLTVGNSATEHAILGASGDLTVGAVALAAGDSATASFTATATGDISIASIAENVGASAAALVAVTAVSGGDIVIGGIAQVAGTSGVAQINVFDSGDGEITIGDVSQVGASVSASIATSGSGDITVGNVAQSATTSSATLYVATTVGSITVGDVNQTVGDSATASVSLTVTAAATGVTKVADITVGTITQAGGDGANDIVNLYGATGTTTSAAAIGGNVHVGGVDQSVGDSGYMSVSITVQDGGTIDVGNITQNGGDSASAYAYISGTSDVTVGDVTVSIGNGVSQTARLQVYGTGDVAVGNVDVSAGDGSNLNAWVTISNDGGHDLTIGDVTVGAGALTTSAGTRPYAYFGAFNEAATGDLTVGNVAMNLGLTATGSLTIAQSNATSSDGGSVTVGDLDLTLADKAILGNAWIHNNAAVFTSTSHTTMNTLGDLTVGDVNVAMGTNASASVTISETMSGTGGDMGTVHVGDVNFAADVNAYAFFEVLAGNYAGGDLAGVEIGDVSFNLDDGGSMTLEVTVSDTSGNIDHFTMGDVAITLGVSGSINDFTVDVRGGSIGDVTMGDMNVTLGEHADATSMSITISASTGDIGTVTIGDIHTVIGQSASYDENNIDIDAAGDIGTVDIGTFHVEVGKNADFVTNTVTVSAGGDIGSVSVGGLQETLAQSATGDGLYVYVYAGGDVGDVTLGDVTVDIGKSASMSDLLYLSVTGQNIDSVSMGNETVNIAASGARSSYDTAFISATGDIGSVTFGDVVYHLNGSGAYTSNGINRTIEATGDIGSVTVGNIEMTAVTGASFKSGYYLTVTAGGDIGDVTVGDVTLQGTSASDSMTAHFNITAPTIDAVTFGDLSVAFSGAVTNYAWITVDVNGGAGGVGAFTVGDVDAVAAISGSAYVTMNVAGTDIGDVTLGDLHVTANAGTAGTTPYAWIGLNETATASVGDLNVGDVSVHISAGTATVSLNVAAATASGDVSIGNIDMAVSLTASATVTGGYGHFALNADAYTGDVSLGTVSFNGTAAATLSVDVEVTGAASVHLGGIAVDGSGSFNGGSYVLTVAAGGADVTVDTVTVAGSGTNDLTDILGGIATTGTLTLGTVDYSHFTGGAAAIDVSGYSGDIHVIGSAAGDTITTNVGSDVLTGGNGTDAFVITTENQNLTTLTAFHSADVVTITDFKAGPTFAETISVDAEHTTVAYYSEKAAASADAAFTLALSTMTDPTQQSDIVAVQVGSDTYVFVDQDGGNDVDMIVKLAGVQTSALNFADFVVS